MSLGIVPTYLLNDHSTTCVELPIHSAPTILILRNLLQCSRPIKRCLGPWIKWQDNGHLYTLQIPYTNTPIHIMYNVYPYPFDVILWCSTDKENVAFAPSEYDISIDKIYIVASCNDDCFGFLRICVFYSYSDTLKHWNWKMWSEQFYR